MTGQKFDSQSEFIFDLDMIFRSAPNSVIKFIIILLIANKKNSIINLLIYFII